MTNVLKIAQLTKVCNSCKEEKLFSEFSKNVSAKDGIQYKCRDCDKQYQEIRRKENYQSNLLYGRKYQAKRREDFDYRLRMLLNASKQRAKIKNRIHNITIDDIKSIYPIDGKCPVFGFNLMFNDSGFRENSPSIDRIDSTEGYTVDNIQIISWKANRIKAYATVEELEIVIAFMKQGN
jgi:transposase-like protein